MIKRLVLAGVLCGSSWLQAQPSASCAVSWPAWEHFQQQMISAEGRVIDFSDARHITTSEGQSYALFFALIQNDKTLFRRLVKWTEDNLARGDLAAYLPAWLWGRTEAEQWGVLDHNSASDSDLWIAYTLLEAGRLWQERHYTVLGHLLLQRIANEEIVELPAFGPVLLPGKFGFNKEGTWRLNPSYVPPQLVWHAQHALPQSVWKELAQRLPDFLIHTAPLGVAPDWVTWQDHHWTYASEAEQIGSYDAIRVYLWIGTLASSPQAELLQQHFKQALPYLDYQGLPAERVQVSDGAATGPGPIGFSAALLPLFKSTDFGAAQAARLKDVQWDQLGYYNFMLYLFGQGWEEQRYVFDAEGHVIPYWVDCQCVNIH